MSVTKLHPSAESDTTPAAVPAADMEARLARVREDERVMLARELHDEVGGTLAALRMSIDRLGKHAGNAPFKPQLDEMRSLCDTASRAIQDVIRALRPGILDQGLVAAIRWEAQEFQRRTGIACNLRSNRDKIDVPKGQGVTLYRICQEALTNVAKHAAASIVSIELERDSEGIKLAITDNGRGFDTSTPISADSFGIVGMRERVKTYGGRVEVTSAQGAGTTLLVRIPLRRAQDTRP
jgi:two-component system, NarL family, sensor histidine kinase UhpB